MTTYGDWTEKKVTRTTALGGQPDFTFAAHEVSKGSSRREIGDTIVWLGRRALVVSTKARDWEKGQRDTGERAIAWLDKAIAQACRQIDGVVRTLKAASDGEIELRSERGVSLLWDTKEADVYRGLVVVNYSAPPGYVPTVTAKTPTVGATRVAGGRAMTIFGWVFMALVVVLVVWLIWSTTADQTHRAEVAGKLLTCWMSRRIR